MNGLIIKFFTPDWPVAQSEGHKTEDLRKTCCLNFHEMNRCHDLLESVIVIQLFSNAISKFNFDN